MQIQLCSHINSNSSNKNAETTIIANTTTTNYGLSPDSPSHDADTARIKLRRQDTSTDSDGEQIFFYDGANLLHAKLYSDTEQARGKRNSICERISGINNRDSSAMTSGATELYNTFSNSNDSGNGNSNRHRNDNPPVDDSTLPSNSGNRAHLSNSVVNHEPDMSPTYDTRSRSPARSKSRSRSRSGSRSRPVSLLSAPSTQSQSRSRSTSDAWSRIMPETLAKKDQQLPSSFTASKPRPNMLARGLSAESQEHDQKGRSPDGSATGSSSRRASTKERFLAMATRGTGSSSPMPSTASRDGAVGPYDSLPSLREHRLSIDERSGLRSGSSPILAQTHNRRQGSPSIGRSDYVGVNHSPPADSMMGFPYNNSSLLVSNDLTRPMATKVPANLRRTKVNKPRPFSVATMEKLVGSNRPDVSVQESPQAEKRRSTQLDRLESPSQFSLKSQHALYTDHQSESSDLGVAAQPRVAGSVSHPLLMALDSSPDRGSKGKEVEKTHELDGGAKLIDSTFPQAVSEDLKTQGGIVHVHEHHIHHHYYCHHGPPAIQPNRDETRPLEQHCSPPASHQRRPEGSSLLSSMFGSHRRRSSALDSEGHTGSFALPSEDGTRSMKPLVNKKRMSILGTMSMTSSMRKRFFAEQKKDQQQQQQQQPSHGTLRRMSAPISSYVYQGYEGADGTMFYHKDGPYAPMGATIRGRRNQRQIPLEGLSDEDEEEEEFGGYVHGVQQSSGNDPQPQQQQQQREKFLSKLKRFLLRPSPSVKTATVAQGAPRSITPVSSSSSFMKTRVSATVRVEKNRWSRNGANVFPPDDFDSDFSLTEGQPAYYQRQQRSMRRRTPQDMFEPPPSPTLQRRDRIDIRTQFHQQSSSPTPEHHLHHHHQHHHHHHHESVKQQQQLLQQQGSGAQLSPSSDDSAHSNNHNRPITAIATATAARITDPNNHRSLQSATVTSVVFSQPISTSHGKDL
ncbi:hypothetical protein BC939DRAFT_441395 [Gamsiella multidivaricata]|uniref:uncharacterized protein n=1 Tax=Gamsiella multidivaricata TaxID=101098 RepID=UPI00221F803F|nr:uncharacterized protein BC939DRAFT_441395 [Gamsiella multidivaricata]KAI7829654.1 hypothetical protein BC939DRAFT_441395 [Gamsiella multidivaricata]